MIKRIVSVAVIACILVLGITQKEQLLQIVNEGGSYAILISMLLVAICVFVPIVPFPVLAGLIGGILAPCKASLLRSAAPAMAGTMLFFCIARYGFKEWAQTKIEQYPQVKEYEEK